MFRAGEINPKEYSHITNGISTKYHDCVTTYVSGVVQHDVVLRIPQAALARYWPQGRTKHDHHDQISQNLGREAD